MLMVYRPAQFIWEGDCFRPANPYWQKECDKQYVIGERYSLVPEHERSHNTHAHFFASLKTAWQNLPEDLIETYPSIEHLRKKALIACGFADERSIVCASKAEALRVAAFIKPMDDFAVVTVSLAVVRVYTAQSQSRKAMNAKEFQASKTMTLEYCAKLIGVTPAALEKQGAAA